MLIRNRVVNQKFNHKSKNLNVVLTSGNIHDSEPAIELLSKVNLNGKILLADRAYSFDKIRNYLEENGSQACIPDKSNFKVKHNFDEDMYKSRDIVERLFQRINNYRYVAFRFDKLDVCFLNFVLLASASIQF